MDEAKEEELIFAVIRAARELDIFYGEDIAAKLGTIEKIVGDATIRREPDPPKGEE